MTKTPNDLELFSGADVTKKQDRIRSTFFYNNFKPRADLTVEETNFQTFEDKAGLWMMDFETYDLTYGTAKTSTDTMYIVTLHAMGGKADRGTFVKTQWVKMFNEGSDAITCRVATIEEYDLKNSMTVEVFFKGYTQRDGRTICEECIMGFDDKTFQTEAKLAQKPICDECGCTMEIDE